MTHAIIDYPRIAVCSLLAFLTCACARWSQADQPPSRPDPKFGHGPSLGMNGESDVDALESHVQILEQKLAEINADLVPLRFALDRMGGSKSNAPILVSAPVPDSAATAASSDLYAPPPRLATAATLFYEADLSQHADRTSAEAAWARLSRQISLPGLSPRLREAGNRIQLSVGPLTSADSVEALCAQIVTVTGSCQVGGSVRYTP